MPGLEEVLELLGLTAEELGWFGLGGVEIPFFVVRGDTVGAWWEHLRAHAESSRHWPVCVGERDELRQLGEAAGTVSMESILTEAASTRPIPAEWMAARTVAMRAHLHGLGLHTLCRLPECENGASEAETPSPSTPEAPTALPDIPPMAGIRVPFREKLVGGALELEPIEDATIVLLPTSRPWEAAAYLQFGGFNACPFPNEHVAIHRHWSEKYGAKIFAMTHDCIEMVVERPPTDVADAVALAHEHQRYSEELDAFDLATAAAKLRGARVWRFWWD